jgi:hypothetical protein
LNLESKINFAKPVKNGATQENEPGGKIRLQSDIRNLNQIGGRPEETFKRGKETIMVKKRTTHGYF